MEVQQGKVEHESGKVGDAKCEVFQFKFEEFGLNSMFYEKQIQAWIKPTEKHAHKESISTNKHRSPSIAGQFR